MLSKPTVIHTQTELDSLIAKDQSIQLIDSYPAQLAELFEIQHAHLVTSPSFKQDQTEYVNQRLESQKKDFSQSNWVYFPWRHCVTHMVNENEYFLLRTNRNRNLVTLEEQEILRQSSVAIAGLSIGSVIARGLIQMGIANRMKVTDFDTVSLTNLNRLSATVFDIGEPKTDVFARSVYEVNPYQRLDIFPTRLTLENLHNFLTSSFIPDIVIDAVDDFKMKVLLRVTAKKNRIPIVMFTNLSNSVLIDVERYDTTPGYEPFHGLIGSELQKILKKPITEELKKRYAVTLVGRENVPPRAVESLQQIHSTLVGRPQLFGTLALATGIASYVIREILLGNSLNSGRYRVSLPECLERQV